MPFAGEVCREAVLLEEFRDRWRFLAQRVLVARGDDDRQGGADRNTPGYERRAACRAARLAVPTRENGSLLGDLVDIRRRMTQRGAAVRVGAEVVPAGIVGHQHDDVWRLCLLCGRWHAGRSYGGDTGQ